MRKRILVVDDEKNIRITIAKSLEKLDCHVEQMISAEEALERMMIIDFDLVLLDLKLPGMSGLEMIDKLREYGKNPRIVIISAHGTIPAVVSSLKSGVLDFIEKPFSPDEIRDIVTKYA